MMEPVTSKQILNLSQIQPITLTKEYEEERYCAIHGNYMAIISQYDNGEECASKCPFCEQEKQNKADELTAQHLTKEHEERCKALNIEPEFYYKSLSDYKPKTTGQEKAKSAIQKMITERKGKVIIIGSNGTGKSMLLNIAAKELGGKVYSMYEISTMIRQSYTQKAERSELEIVNELASIPFLGIDELGRIAMSEAVMNWFSYILDKRSVRKLPFALAGNIHLKKDCPEKGCPKCFENQFDTDILSRLRDSSTFIVIKADDYRKSNHTCFYWEDKEIV